VDGVQVAYLDQLHRGPTWIARPGGVHVLHVLPEGRRGVLDPVEVSVTPGRTALVEIRPSEYWPFRGAGPSVSVEYTGAGRS
jgi:hypothetical protein